LRDIVLREGTPVIVLSEERLRANVRDLASGLGAGVTLRYCAKTNPEPRVLSIVREEGAHVLASHAAEVRLAVATGFAPETIAYQRPVTEAREIDDAITLGVRRFHAFRTADLDTLSRIAVQRGVTLRVSLRIALGRSGLIVLNAASRRLGFAVNEIDARPRAGLVIDALNTYIGTQQERVEAYRPALRELVRLAAAIPSVEELNLGGGIPSNTLRRVTPARLLRRDRASSAPSLREYAASLRALFDEEAKRPLRLALEPGRSIVGNAAVLLTRVVATQGRWRFLDCGRNVLVESPLAFTRPMTPLEPRDGRKSLVHFSGPTLNTLDVIDMRRRMPELRDGDVIVVGDAGAYTLSRATTYAGVAPKVVLVRTDGAIETIRGAETAH
jgi:diaminopimelate decarboxylase